MPRFSKEQIHGELSKILLIQADHIANTAHPDIAEQFIGFPLQNDEFCYFESDPARVDLSRFHATTLLDACYEYAVSPSVLTGHDDSLVQDLQVFVLGMPQADVGGEIHSFLTESGVCRMVAEISLARFKLDEGDALSGREVALLANMTEGAVRNALADKSENGLQAISGTKNPVMIENDEALRWLMGRRGFVPTPFSLDEDRFVTERILKSRSTKEIGEIVSRLSWTRFGSPDDAPAKLGWSDETFKAWCEGTQTFDETKAIQLAEAFGTDVPLFVGKMRETTLRRDLVVGKGTGQ